MIFDVQSVEPEENVWNVVKNLKTRAKVFAGVVEFNWRNNGRT